MNRFTGKTVLIVGASGGLGSVIAQAFSVEGASLALAARRSLPAAGLAVKPADSTHIADLTDPASLAALRDEVLAAHGQVDVVINATGYDARKPLADHSLDDFRRTLEVNLLGVMLLTQTFLPIMESGVILHLGGFADGRLAFPFYSADAASRAGVRAFAESVNRELALDHRPVVVSFFSPSPADTEAERPFHPLWEQMGTPIVSPEQVAAELVEAVARREKVHVMGGFVTRFFAALNAVSPALADRLMMKHYGEMMSRFFGDDQVVRRTMLNGDYSSKDTARLAIFISKVWCDALRKKAHWRTLGILLVILSCVAYGLLILVPFLPLSTTSKLLLSPLLVGAGEATFWVGGALLGKEIVARFKRYLNPCNWCARD